MSYDLFSLKSGPLSQDFNQFYAVTGLRLLSLLLCVPIVTSTAQYNWTFDNRFTEPVVGYHVRGDGLHVAVTGEITKFWIHTNLSKADTEIVAWFYGPSMFSGIVSSLSSPFEVSYLPLDSGLYEVHLLEIRDRGNYSIKYLEGSPFSLKVTGSAQFPSKFCHDFSLHYELDKQLYDKSGLLQKRFGGRWLRCKDLPSHIREAGCTSEGWVWIPQSCYYKILPIGSYQSLMHLQKPLWVMIFGSSTIRAQFFFWLMQVLPQVNLQGLPESSLWKCWGYMDVRIGSLRVSYKDMRIWSSLPSYVEPHPLEPSYTEHISSFFKDIIEGKAAKEFGGNAMFLLIEIHTHVDPLNILSRLPLDKFKGYILFTIAKADRGISAVSKLGIRTSEVILDTLRSYVESNASHLAGRIGFVDSLFMSYPYIQQMERVNLNRYARHQHRWCGNRVCSVPDEMLLAMVYQNIDRVLMKLDVGRKLGYQGIENINSYEECEKCPPSLFPATFDPTMNEVVCRRVSMNKSRSSYVNAEVAAQEKKLISDLAMLEQRIRD